MDHGVLLVLKDSCRISFCSYIYQITKHLAVRFSEEFKVNENCNSEAKVLLKKVFFIYFFE